MFFFHRSGFLDDMRTSDRDEETSVAQELTQYTPQPSAPLSTELQPNVSAVESAGPSLGAVLRRRWRVIMAIWVVVMLIGLPYTWLRIHPTFTATAKVEVP